MLLQYMGQKPIPFRIPTPIPYVSKTEEGQGELVFTPTCNVPNEDWATHLLTQCGGLFAPVGVTPPAPPAPSKTERYCGKRFSGPAGKWRAYAFLEKHGLGDSLGMTKLQIGDKVMHWELVPIAQADITIADKPKAHNKGRPLGRPQWNKGIKMNTRSVPTPSEDRAEPSVSSQEEGQKE